MERIAREKIGYVELRYKIFQQELYEEHFNSVVQGMFRYISSIEIPIFNPRWPYGPRKCYIGSAVRNSLSRPIWRKPEF